jgi:hypothetical protein
MTLQDEESPIDQEIVNEIAELIPESWYRAVLDVEYSTSDRGEIFDHTIYNPDGRSELVEPSDLLYDATSRLQQLFRKHGGFWIRVRYEIDIAEESVTYKARFDSSPLTTDIQ